MEELKRLMSDLNQSEDLRIKFDETLGRIAKEGQSQNDGEVFVNAAKELGYEITIAALEQRKAEAEELDPEELAEASGGEGETCNKDFNCSKNYDCVWFYTVDHEDEHGHANFCVTGWHCYTAVMHSDSERKSVACWSDYDCIFVNK